MYNIREHTSFATATIILAAFIAVCLMLEVVWKRYKKDLEEYEKDFKKAIREQNAILEVSKYPVKDTDVIKGNKVTDENVETVLVLDNALAYKRLIGYGGLLKQIHKELNLGDAEDGDLVYISENDEVANGAFDVIGKWLIGLKNYVIKRD